MKSKHVAASVAICLSAVMAVVVWAQSESPSPTPGAPTRWQHMAVTHDGASAFTDPEFGRQINRFGDAGWELVDVESISQEGTTANTVFFFKKPK